MERTITLVRHGQQDSAAEADASLSPIGVEQAGFTAEMLASEKIDVLYFSPLRRARQTAEIIAGALKGVHLVQMDELREGVPTIPPQASIAMERWLYEERGRTPEYLEATRARFDIAYARIFRVAERRPAHDLVVAHGNLIRYLICRALGVDENLWASLFIHHASMSRVVIAPETAKKWVNPGEVVHALYAFNQHCHLPPDLLTV